MIILTIYFSVVFLMHHDLGVNIVEQIKAIKKTIDRQERNSSSYVEDRVRDIAGNMFGSRTLGSFLAKCLYDLVVLSSPHECSHEDIVEGENRLDQYATENLSNFIKAYYSYLIENVDDPTQLLVKFPWVIEEIVNIDNIKCCGGVLNNSQNAMKNRILFALEPVDTIMSPFRRSAGPGLSIIIWCACQEFLGELEVDCRGKVDLLLTTHRAVVMGAEIKTSSADIPRAKKQIIRRFKIISKCLNVTHAIESGAIIFIGRVFYRNIPQDSVVEQSEYASGNGLETLSFYYHRV